MFEKTWGWNLWNISQLSLVCKLISVKSFIWKISAFPGWWSHPRSV
jgi:hypothetical protein